MRLSCPLAPIPAAFFLIATKDILPVLVSLLLAVFIGGVAAALLGVVIGIPVLRLKGDYLAIVTLAFGEIIKSVFNSLKITGGAKGLFQNPAGGHFIRILPLCFILMLLVILLVSHLVNSLTAVLSAPSVTII